MTSKSNPYLWTSLALTGLASTIPGGLAAQSAPRNASPLSQPRAISPLLVEGEQGEQGESGLARVEDPNEAYAIRLALVEAHLRAAIEAKRAGYTSEAMGLAGHPEVEVMDEVRTELAARDVPDFSDALDDFAGLIADDVDDATLMAAYDRLAEDITNAMRAGGTSDHAMFKALYALVRGSAIEYADAMDDAAEPDQIATLESLGFLAVAQDMAARLAKDEDPVTVAAGAKAGEAIAAATSLLAATDSPDTTILYGAAAQVQLAGLRVQ